MPGEGSGAGTGEPEPDGVDCTKADVGPVVGELDAEPVAAGMSDGEALD
jgi:hypothetical protein